jgi:hypothetical protein
MKSRDKNFLRIKKVCSLFKKISDGAHGNTTGFHGSLTPYSIWKIFKALNVFGRSFADLGAGNGVVLSAAFSNGASKSHGFELPENKANRYIFKAAMAQMTKIFCSRAAADLEFKNVEKVETELFLSVNFHGKLNSLLSTGQGAATWNRGRLFFLEWDAL